MGTRIEAIGNVYGRLTVIAEADPVGMVRRVVCVCTCGTEKIFRLYNLRTGDTKSCGCLNSELVIKYNTTHAMCKRPEYTGWKHLVGRCTNKKNPGYKNYGGRGITICKRWRQFDKFMEDMGERPARTSLERTNNNKGYCKSNCVWATHKQQANNKRTNKMLTYKGKTMTMMQWSEHTGISYNKLRDRIKYKWSIERALETP